MTWLLQSRIEFLGTTADHMKTVRPRTLERLQWWIKVSFRKGFFGKSASCNLTHYVALSIFCGYLRREFVIAPIRDWTGDWFTYSPRIRAWAISRMGFRFCRLCDCNVR